MYVDYTSINLIENMQRKIWFEILSQEPYYFLKFLVIEIVFINVGSWYSARSMGQGRGQGFRKHLFLSQLCHF